MKNKQPKRELANKMLSNKEREEHISIFDSKQWRYRKSAIQKRIYVKK